MRIRHPQDDLYGPVGGDVQRAAEQSLFFAPSSHDAVQHVLDTPMARAPGQAWAYNSGTSILLGAIIEQVTGEDLLSFAREHLFDPIGISYAYWEKARGNHYHTETWEVFFIIDGRVRVVVYNINRENKEEHFFEKGDLFFIEPYEVHTFSTLTDAKWINMLSKPLKEENPDFRRYEVPLIKP